MISREKILQLSIVELKNLAEVPKASKDDFVFFMFEVSGFEITTKKTSLFNPVFGIHTIRFSTQEESLHVKLFRYNKKVENLLLLGSKKISFAGRIIKNVPFTFVDVKLVGGVGIKEPVLLTLSLRGNFGIEPPKNFVNNGGKTKTRLEIKKLFSKFLLFLVSILEQSSNPTFLELIKKSLDPYNFLVKGKRVSEEDLSKISLEIELYKDCVKEAKIDLENVYTLSSGQCENLLVILRESKKLNEMYTSLRISIVSRKSDIVTTKAFNERNEDVVLRRIGPKVLRKNDATEGKSKLKKFMKLFVGNKKKRKTRLKKMKMIKFEDSGINLNSLFIYNEFQESFQTLLYKNFRAEKKKKKIYMDCFAIEFKDVMLYDLINKEKLAFRGFLNKKEIFFKLYEIKQMEVDERIFDEMTREIVIMMEMSSRHSNLLNYYGCYLEEKHIGLCTEFCEYDSLLNCFQRNTKNKKVSLEYGEKMKILFETALAMKALHNSNFIHKNLNSKNVLLNKNLTVKVRNAGINFLNLYQQRKKKEDDLFFEYQYYAPELFDKSTINVNNYSKLTDIYAFGVIMFEVFSGDFNSFGIQNNFLSGLIQKKTSYVLPNMGKLKNNKWWIRDLLQKCISSNEEWRPSFHDICEIFYEKLKLEEVNLTENVTTSKNCSEISFDEPVLVFIREKHESFEESMEFELKNGTIEEIEGQIKTRWRWRSKEIQSLYLFNENIVGKFLKLTSNKMIKEHVENESMLIVIFKGSGVKKDHQLLEKEPIILFFVNDEEKNGEKHDFLLEDRTHENLIYVIENVWKNVNPNKKLSRVSMVHCMDKDKKLKRVVNSDEDVSKLNENSVLFVKFGDKKYNDSGVEEFVSKIGERDLMKIEMKKKVKEKLLTKNSNISNTSKPMNLTISRGKLAKHEVSGKETVESLKKELEKLKKSHKYEIENINSLHRDNIRKIREMYQKENRKLKFQVMEMKKMLDIKKRLQIESKEYKDEIFRQQRQINNFQKEIIGYKNKIKENED